MIQNIAKYVRELVGIAMKYSNTEIIKWVSQNKQNKSTSNSWGFAEIHHKVQLHFISSYGLIHLLLPLELKSHQLFQSLTVVCCNPILPILIDLFILEYP